MKRLTLTLFMVVCLGVFIAGCGTSKPSQDNLKSAFKEHIFTLMGITHFIDPSDIIIDKVDVQDWSNFEEEPVKAEVAYELEGRKLKNMLHLQIYKEKEEGDWKVHIYNDGLYQDFVLNIIT